MATSTAERIKKYREKQRHLGMRLVQIWVPDTRQPGFAAECRRQVRILNKMSPREKRLIEAWERTADRTGWI